MPPRKKPKTTSDQIVITDQRQTSTSSSSAMNDGWVGWTQKLYKLNEKAVASERSSHAPESDSQHPESSQSQSGDHRLTEQQERLLHALPELQDPMRNFQTTSGPDAKTAYSQQERYQERLACLEDMHHLLTQRLDDLGPTSSPSHDQQKADSYRKMREIVERTAHFTMKKDQEVLLEYINQSEETPLTAIGWNILTQDHLHSMQEPMTDGQTSLDKAIALLKTNQSPDPSSLSITAYLNFDFEKEITISQYKVGVWTKENQRVAKVARGSVMG